MKLIFANGEHAPVALDEGVMRVGSDADCALVLAMPGIARHHSEIEVRGGQVFVRSIDATAPTVVNGRQITQETPNYRTSE